MTRTYSAGLILVLATTLAGPAYGQRHKDKDVKVMEGVLSTMLVFPDRDTGIYV